MSVKQLSLFDQQPEDSNKFFARKRPWSAAKHRIMLKYIQAHCYNLGGSKPYQSMHINYVDGFAGAGKYDEGIGIENFVDESKFWQRYKTEFLDTDGSPLIALKCAKIFSFEERVTLRCFFTEEDKDLNQELKSNCSLIGEGLTYKVYEPQRFDKTLTQIMNELDKYPTLFFLDAFGVKGVTFEQICYIADYVSKYKGELFLLFHNRAVARHTGFYKTNYKNSKEQKTAETYTQNLTKLLGHNSDLDWKPKWLECQDQEQKQTFERWALKYLKSRLQQESSFKGVANFEIKETYNDSRPQYNIVVGSNHPQKAFGEFLNEFFCKENKLLFFEDDKSGKNHKFLTQSWDRENDERVERIKPKIIEILRKHNQEWITLKDVISLIILEIGKLGYLSRPKYREILLDFHKKNIIEAKELGARGNLTLDNYVRAVQ
ncbi:three-Cys-motif partner protein TcmP [Nostoc sp.]